MERLIFLIKIKRIYVYCQQTQPLFVTHLTVLGKITPCIHFSPNLRTETREAVQARRHQELYRIPSTLTIFRYKLPINCRLPNFGDKLITADKQRLEDCLITTIVSTTLRASLSRAPSAASETALPFQRLSSNSSLATTRSQFSIK